MVSSGVMGMAMVLKIVREGSKGEILDFSCWGISFELLLVGKMVREVE